MREVIILLFFSLLFAAPPIDAVQEYNSNMANYLEDNFNSNISQSSSTEIFGQSLDLLTSVDIVGPTLTIDNLTYSTDSISLLLARGHFISHLTSNDGQSTCNVDYHPLPNCDLDYDDCAEFEQNSSVVYSAEILFTFQNTSVSVPFSSTIIEIPEEITSKMESSSGADQLDVSVSGDAIFTYLINDNEFDGLQCNDNLYSINVSIPISVNDSFAVAGQKKLFFLRAPILLEQWESNNHFDVIVLSQSPLFYAEILLDGNSATNFTLKNFSITTGPYGVERIISENTLLGIEHGPNVTTPSLLEEENNSFAYSYEFNFTYVGIGKHNLSLFVIDNFLGFAQYNETILSRTLTHNTANNSVSSRPSLPYPITTLNATQLSLGFIVLIVFLAFVYFWATR
ncbi:MAG: hypothetical protein ABH842_03190 [Candidatus Micrarchaeota archaeon]